MHSRSALAVVAAAGLAIAAPATGQHHGGSGWGQQHGQQQRFQDSGSRERDPYGQSFNRSSRFDSSQQWRPVDYLREYEGLSVTLSQMQGDTETFVRILDGDVYAYLDGRQVPTRNILKRGDTIRIVDQQGRTAALFALPQPPWSGGQQAFGRSTPQQWQEPWQQQARGLDQWQQDRWQVSRSPQVPGQMLGSPEKPVANLQTPAIGVLMLSASPQDLRGTNYDGGVLVDATHDGMPADRAGLKQGDIIVKIDGREGVTPDSLRQVLSQKSPGETLRLTYVRNGQERTANVRTTSMIPAKVNWDYMITGLDSQQLERQKSQMLRERQGQRQAQGDFFQDMGRIFGIRLSDADDDDFSTIEEYQDGLVVHQVTRGTKLHEAGVRPGDTIVAVDGRLLSRCDDLKEAIQNKQPGDALRLTVVRDGREHDLNLRLHD